jgi:hypothetical protein
LTFSGWLEDRNNGTNVYTLTQLPGGTTRLESDSRYVFDSAVAQDLRQRC